MVGSLSLKVRCSFLRHAFLVYFLLHQGAGPDDIAHILSYGWYLHSYQFLNVIEWTEHVRLFSKDLSSVPISFSYRSRYLATSKVGAYLLKCAGILVLILCLLFQGHLWIVSNLSLGYRSPCWKDITATLVIHWWYCVLTRKLEATLYFLLV